MRKLLTFLDEPLRDAVANHHAADRQIAGRERLGHRHEVGPGTEVLAAEPLTGATETADDLVRDQQDAVPVADALDLGPVTFWWHDDATRALHRLGDECRDAFGPEREDLLFQRLCGRETEVRRAGSAAELEPIGLLDMLDARHRQQPLLVHPLHAAQARAGDRAAVVAVPAPDDDVALRLAFELPVAAREPDRGIDRFAARAGEKHVLELRWRDLGELRCKIDRGRGRALEETVVVRQLVHLPVGSIGQFPPAIAQRHAPQARHAIENPVAIRIVEIDALAARDQPRPLRADLARVRERMQEVRLVERLPVGLAARSRHHTFSSRCSRSQELITCRNTSYSDSLTIVNAATKGSPRMRTSASLSLSCRSASSSERGNA